MMPRGPGIRPTSNKVREALFSILSAKIPGSAILDLFAGSGSMGLEAISRGAEKAVFVDNNTGSISAIKKNLKDLGVSADVKVMQLGVVQAVKKLCGQEKFDIVFMDPPYFKGWIKKILLNLSQYDILKHPALLICEHHKKEELPQQDGPFFRFKESRYGDTVLSFYKKNQ